ncbi:MAG: heavy-metal-associated domain-containing protein [Clostridiales bacterium]|nr:heavy-metal-associated domain-containing protein [Clostridiales bacterium]
MIKYVFEVTGMMCCNCEKHVVEEIKKLYKFDKVVASHVEKTVTVTAKKEIDVQAVENAIKNRGYNVLSVKKEEFVKKGLFR